MRTAVNGLGLAQKVTLLVTPLKFLYLECCSKIAEAEAGLVCQRKEVFSDAYACAAPVPGVCGNCHVRVCGLRGLVSFAGLAAGRDICGNPVHPWPVGSTAQQYKYYKYFAGSGPLVTTSPPTNTAPARISTLETLLNRTRAPTQLEQQPPPPLSLLLPFRLLLLLLPPLVQRCCKHCLMIFSHLTMQLRHFTLLDCLNRNDLLPPGHVLIPYWHLWLLLLLQLLLLLYLLLLQFLRLQHLLLLLV